MKNKIQLIIYNYKYRIQFLPEPLLFYNQNIFIEQDVWTWSWNGYGYDDGYGNGNGYGHGYGGYGYGQIRNHY